MGFGQKNPSGSGANLPLVTQFGLSLVLPPILCFFGARWLMDRFGLGSWVLLIAVLLAGLGLHCFSLYPVLPLYAPAGGRGRNAIIRRVASDGDSAGGTPTPALGTPWSAICCYWADCSCWDGIWSRCCWAWRWATGAAAANFVLTGIAAEEAVQLPPDQARRKMASSYFSRMLMLALVLAAGLDNFLV